MAALFRQLKEQSAAMTYSQFVGTGAHFARDLRKVRNLTEEHVLNIVGRIASDFPDIVQRIKKNHGKFLRKASSRPEDATPVIGLPSLPGRFRGSDNRLRAPGPSPRLPILGRLGPFQLELAPANNNTGGSLISFALRFGSGSRSEKDLFRLDYHGHSGEDEDATYFQVPPRIEGQSHEPWFHYHTPEDER